jgi:hypothetical protein
MAKYIKGKWLHREFDSVGFEEDKRLGYAAVPEDYMEFIPKWGGWGACGDRVKYWFEAMGIPFDKVKRFRVIVEKSSRDADTVWRVSSEGRFHGMGELDFASRLNIPGGPPPGFYNAWIEYEED